MALSTRQVNIELAEEIGLKEAMILQQIHYWIGKCGKNSKGRKWIYNSYQEWKDQFPVWSVRSIRSAINNLEKQSLIKTDRKFVRGGNLQKWYSINYSSPKLKKHKLVGTEIKKDIGLAKSATPPADKRKGSGKKCKGVWQNLPEGMANSATSYIVKESTESNTKNIHQIGDDLEKGDILLWFDNHEDIWKGQFEEYVKEVCEPRAKGGIRTSFAAFRRGVLERVYAGDAPDFKPLTEVEIEKECLGMYAHGKRPD
jgi:hypothetical protein